MTAGSPAQPRGNASTLLGRAATRAGEVGTADSQVQPEAGTSQAAMVWRSFRENRVALASLVVLLFIRNFRVTIIAALAIPTSIVGTFLVMRGLDFTLNNMTMLALSLATGIVIDDAIVVLENIFRHVEEKGSSPQDAAIAATSEIGLAVMATTLSLVVIFVPVAFMTGQVGRYFYSFGITSATAIMLSMFVSFTLTPALCAWWLRPQDASDDEVKLMALNALQGTAPEEVIPMLEKLLEGTASPRVKQRALFRLEMAGLGLIQTRSSGQPKPGPASMP